VTFVGVDFGTATTLVATADSWGPPALVPIGRSTRWLPSLARPVPGGYVVGEDAEEVDPDRVVRSVKRAITERRRTLTVAGPYGLEDVDADAAARAILTELVRRAAAAGLSLDRRPVRFGCPAMWDGAQRRRLIEIAASAGLTVADAALVDEPVAAGLAWLSHRYLGHAERPAGRLLVLDMGGGTLDIAVLAVAGGPTPEVSVLSSLGVALAGDALDVAIARDLAAEMARNRIDVAFHPQPELAWALLERAAREAKLRLSTAAEHPVVLPRALGYPHVIRYPRTALEAALAPQLDGAENLIVSALRAARVTSRRLGAAELRAIDRDELLADVDFVLLVGGMSRVPYVGRRVGALFPKAQLYTDAGVAPDEAVVAGLAGARDERVSLHRPGVDLVLCWSGGAHTLYQAYTPLYQPWQVYSGDSELAYEQRVRPPSVPSSGVGEVRAVAADGAPLRLVVDGRDSGGLPVRFGPGETVLRVSCDGLVTVLDGSGATTAVRVQRWPAVGSRGDTGLTLRRLSDPSPTVFT
jgi:molecular chaperone DnaK (HSP70)